MPVAASHPTWRTVALTTLGTVMAMVALTIGQQGADARYAWSDEMEHATGHAALGVPLLMLVVAAVRLWPAPRPMRTTRQARRLIVVALAMVSAGQLLEALGAFGYDGDERAQPVLAVLHDLGLVGGPFGLLLLVGGIVLALYRPSVGLGIIDVALLGAGVVGIAAVFIGLTPVAGALIIVAVIAAAIGRWLHARTATS